MRGIAAPLTKLSIFVVVTIVFTAMLGLSIANLNLSDTKTYTARFTDATMLIEGDDVRIAGVRVGQVADVRIVDRRQAEVEFEVDQNRRLPAGVTATIKFRNLVGQRYVALERGTGEPGGYLEPGGNIPIERTRPALDLTELFNGFKPLFRALSPEDVNKLSYEIIQVLQGEGGTVENLLAHTASLTTTIAEKDQVIGQVIDNLNSVLQTLNEHTPQLSDLVARLQQFVSGLASDREPIGDAIESLGELSDTTAGLLREARQPLKQDIQALGTLVGNLNDSEPLVEHFIQFLPEKVTRMSATADYGSWFNFYLCEANGNVGVPGVVNEPVHLPVMPASRERCLS
ncbi:phospholipid/cholesterol/gamma-HCH transport system substrate-binding protein [Saccharomonospora amisosensis]|uniref:Phospholipid/cholesterol/gamma-HCH transport system substrate-binding protein n=1 Tax=Saccharomonospora amisosensis TaxID=1128677 RepID=A0A7X5UUS7_9PSEU|nr:MCE family protein [Saccharomonospora amisosensis]NIJ14242.1 phospholipid/cholesterol/gamma-HCH transport system substrate-binding protein [Saccharomonospora amisosensis]